MVKVLKILYTFVLEHNILLLMVLIPVFIVFIGSLRIFLGLNLISNIFFFFIFSLELTFFFVILYTNLKFWTTFVLFNLKNDKSFFIEVYAALNRSHALKATALIFFTTFYSVPIKVFLNFKNPIFIVTKTIINIFLVWLFSLYLYFFFVTFVTVFILIEGLIFHRLFLKESHFFKNSRFNFVFEGNDTLKIQYVDYFFGKNFTTNVGLKFSIICFSVMILYIIYLGECIEMDLVNKLLLDVLDDNEVYFKAHPSEKNLFSEEDTFVEKLDKFKRLLKLHNTMFLKAKILTNECIYSWFFK